MHWLLLYELTDEYLEGREPLRPEHLALARAAHERGELLLAGATADRPDTAVYAWRCEDDGPLRAFVKADPYVRAGLVRSWTIRPWAVAIGAD